MLGEKISQRWENFFTSDLRDLIFRGLFSSIFVGLGMEHLLDDRIIQHLMPTWVIYPQLVSIASGLVLLLGGLSIMLGFYLQWGARMLGLFLVAVTVLVHLPGIFSTPPQISEEWAWLWTVFQRSNLVKNLCLFGVCVHLTQHKAGKFSLDHYLKKLVPDRTSGPT